MELKKGTMKCLKLFWQFHEQWLSIDSNHSSHSFTLLLRDVTMMIKKCLTKLNDKYLDRVTDYLMILEIIFSHVLSLGGGVCRAMIGTKPFYCKYMVFYIKKYTFCC